IQRFCPSNGLFDILEIGVSGPARVVPKSQADQIGPRFPKNFIRVTWDIGIIMVLCATILHLIDIGKVRAIKEKLGIGGVFFLLLPLLSRTAISGIGLV